MWLSRDGVARYRWMTTRRTLNYVRLPFFIDIGGPVLQVEHLNRWGCGSGTGKLLARAEFIAMLELRPLTDEESEETSHYSVRTAESHDDAIVPRLELAGWAFRRGAQVAVTRHDLFGRTTTETRVCR